MTYCAAYGCNNSKKKDNCRNKTFFQFPLKNPNLLKTWIAKIRRENFVPSYASVLCSDHFEEECFEYQNFTNRRHLKPGSVPTNFVFTKSPSSRRILERCKPSTSTEICEPPVSNEEMGTEEIQRQKEMKPGTASVGTQTISFGEVMDLLEETQAELKKLKATLQKKEFIPENICDDEPPSSPKEQQMTFSCYKNANTLKGMIGITPNGAISFISELYCGSISDKQLFIKSKLMDLLEPNDVVMADKGFLIENELASVGCKLQCPAFLRDKIQFDVSEMVSNCRLSNVRVTVERAIGRIKQYKYFEGALPYRSLHNANSVFYCMHAL
ncbi:THAP-type domain-containing protein [Trichonephila clavipes]|nr:THAP-type domain-containing protein [Trichonephila clavipes]